MPNPAAIHHRVSEKMESALEHLKRDLASLRTGRASIALFDGVRVVKRVMSDHYFHDTFTESFERLAETLQLGRPDRASLVRRRLRSIRAEHDDFGVGDR